ncbi:MAG: aldose 1-epimerase [Lutibacter sp.]|nr:aldose 1-epimerase [Lutibacter sp.]
MEPQILISPDKNSVVKIDKGELVSFLKNKEELIHQKGQPGWRNSDTEMFPVIGPTEANDFTVSTPKGRAIQDQHGLLRELSYTLMESGENFAVFQKDYAANTIVKNSKFPEKSPEEKLSWPYDFRFKKLYELSNDSLKITFEIEAEKGMPFMLGYHPAFKLSGDKGEICKTKTQEVSLQKIMDGGSTAFPFFNTQEIKLIKNKGYNISIKTKGFDNFMLWTEVPNMLCIEPITAYPYTEGEPPLSEKLIKISTGKDSFEVVIAPFKDPLIKSVYL